MNRVDVIDGGLTIISGNDLHLTTTGIPDCDLLPGLDIDILSPSPPIQSRDHESQRENNSSGPGSSHSFPPHLSSSANGRGVTSIGATGQTYEDHLKLCRGLLLFLVPGLAYASGSEQKTN